MLATSNLPALVADPASSFEKSPPHRRFRLSEHVVQSRICQVGQSTGACERGDGVITKPRQQRRNSLTSCSSSCGNRLFVQVRTLHHQPLVPSQTRGGFEKLRRKQVQRNHVQSLNPFGIESVAKICSASIRTNVDSRNSEWYSVLTCRGGGGSVRSVPYSQKRVHRGEKTSHVLLVYPPFVTLVAPWRHSNAWSGIAPVQTYTISLRPP